jgi:hypothetical protein
MVFEKLAEPFLSTSSMWVGAKVGVFASAMPGSALTGSAAFANFTLVL